MGVETLPLPLTAEHAMSGFTADLKTLKGISSRDAKMLADAELPPS